MGKKNAGAKEAQQARSDEQARQQRIREGTSSINALFDKQFNDGFFDKRRQAYLGYATPQLDEQYGDSQKQLTYALTRSGLLDSSARGEEAARLQKRYDLGKQSIADQAVGEATTARNAVEDARANLIAMLNATGDAQGAAQAALARSTALSQPGTYSPLAQLFQDSTGMLAQQAAAERAAYYSGGAYAPRFNTGLFTPRSSSVTVRGG